MFIKKIWIRSLSLTLLCAGGLHGIAGAQVSEEGPMELFHENQRVYMDCNSIRHRQSSCSAGGPIRNVRLVRQYSESPCIRGQSWGFVREFVWVDRGCRGQFEVSLDYDDHHHRPPDRDRDRDRDDRDHHRRPDDDRGRHRHPDDDRDRDRDRDHGRRSGEDR